MNFGQAIELMKRGERMARSGWNGKGMHIRLIKGAHPQLPSERTEPLIDGVASGLFDYGNKNAPPQMPYLLMQAASGAEVRGWLASQTDMLAEDWGIAQ